MSADRAVLETITIEEIDLPCLEDGRNWAYEMWLRRMRAARAADIDTWLDALRAALQKAQNPDKKHLRLVKLSALPPVEPHDFSLLESRVAFYCVCALVVLALLIGAASTIGRLLK